MQVLDAPQFCDDFYRSQLDWGANNVVAVCLGKKVYLWNGTDSSVRSPGSCALPQKSGQVGP